MRKTLAEIAKIIDGEVQGDEHLVITGISGIKEAKKGHITFVANPKYFSLVEQTQASAVIVSFNIPFSKKPLIRVKNPSLAFSKFASTIIGDLSHHVNGIHSTAVIAEDVVIGKNVAIGPCVVVQSKANIGNDTVIHGGCFIGYEVIVGQGCLIYPNTTIRERVQIGSNVIIHCGAVIGSDGFGFADVKGVHEKIPQVGIVVVENDVEIGSNVTIDRARFDKTFIGQGTKIDNLVQIAHNVIIGKNCIIVSQTGISGSVEIKDGAILAGQSGIAGHLTIGEGAIVAAQAGVTKSVQPKDIVSGYPAKPHNIAKKVNAALQRLPIYVQKIQDLEKRIEYLESKEK